MKNLESQKPAIKKLGPVRRQAVTLSQEMLIKAEPLQLGKRLPLVIQPAVDGLNLIAWAANNRAFIETRLLEHAGILFRNFKLNGEAEFEQLINAVSGELLEYYERSSPRTQIRGNIYSSTDYPADKQIFLHNENSYQRSWPLKIFFFCVTPASQGGETPIADCRKIFERIDPLIRERFIQKGWMYVRNFGNGFGLPWQKVFQTNDQAIVEEYCRRNEIEVEWQGGDHLRTRAVGPPAVRHPKTGEMTWFNHVTFFHVSTLETKIREMLLAEFSEEDLPTTTYYGDGSPIEPLVLDELRTAYRQESVIFSWQQGDVLLLDNMLAAHGRMSYVGPRKILVGMAELVGR